MNYKHIESVRHDLCIRNANARNVILQSKQLVVRIAWRCDSRSQFLIDFFGHECNKKSKNLVQVQLMWKEHCQGYEGLFMQINSLVNSYNKV